MDRSLWDRGLVANPGARYKYKSQEEVVCWELGAGSVEDGGGVFSGETASDGSKTGRWRDVVRTGWAVSTSSGEGAGITSAYGPLPHALPVQRKIARAELWGMFMALVFCCPPLKLLVDCASLFAGVRNGKRWATSSRRPHADVWRKNWGKLEDIGVGEGGVTLEKVKAHLSAKDKSTASEEKLRKTRLNEEADAKAKKGATLGSNAFTRYVADAQDRAAHMVKAALGAIHAVGCEALKEGEDWPDAEKYEAKRAKKKEIVPKTPAQPHAKKHRFERLTGETFQCESCKRRVYSTKAKLVAERYDGLGHIAAKLPVQIGMGDKFAVCKGHFLWMSAGTVWCSRCGQYAGKQVKGLSTPCGGTIKAKWVWKNLAAGKPARARGKDIATSTPARLTIQCFLKWQFALDGEKRAPTEEDARAAIRDGSVEAAYAVIPLEG